jgi:hypothetical protein
MVAITPYIKSVYPTIEGNDRVYFDREFQKIQDCLRAVLDLYEEGEFTPTYTTTGTDFTAVTYDANNYGRYTRVGREVHFRLRIATDSITVGAASGTLVVGGLPYDAADLSGTTGDWQTVAIGYRGGFLATPPISGLIRANDQIMLFHLSSITAASIECPAATTVDTGTDDNLLYIGGSYMISDGN